MNRAKSNPGVEVFFSWICLVGDCFTDCTMVNHHQTTIWVNIFGVLFFQETRKTRRMYG